MVLQAQNGRIKIMFPTLYHRRKHVNSPQRIVIVAHDQHNKWICCVRVKSESTADGSASTKWVVEKGNRRRALTNLQERSRNLSNPKSEQALTVVPSPLYKSASPYTAILTLPIMSETVMHRPVQIACAISTRKPDMQ